MINILWFNFEKDRYFVKINILMNHVILLSFIMNLDRIENKHSSKSSQYLIFMIPASKLSVRYGSYIKDNVVTN